MRIGLTWMCMTACVAIGAATPAAPAQHGSMSMGLYSADSFAPDLSRRDLQLIVRVLGLGADEERAMLDLYDSYAQALLSEGGEVREFVNAEVERAEAYGDPKLIDKTRDRVKQWEKRSEQIEKTFLTDLKSLESKDQQSRWPIVERELRRLKQIGDGRLAGEGVDLVRLTEDVLNAPPTKEMADLLNRYSDDLDKALVARDAFLKDNREAFSAAIKDDLKKATALWEDSQRVRGTVRDINDRYARLIAESLPTDRKGEFERAYFDRSYRHLVRPTRVEGYVKDAADLGTLSPEQQRRAAEVKSRYESQRRALLQRAAKAWRQFETEDKPQQLAEALGERPAGSRAYTGGWLPESHPLIQYRKERLELDQTTRAAMDAVLTPEQRGAVPARWADFAKFEDWSPYGL